MIHNRPRVGSEPAESGTELKPLSSMGRAGVDADFPRGGDQSNIVRRPVEELLKTLRIPEPGMFLKMPTTVQAKQLGELSGPLASLSLRELNRPELREVRSTINDLLSHAQRLKGGGEYLNSKSWADSFWSFIGSALGKTSFSKQIDAVNIEALQDKLSAIDLAEKGKYSSEITQAIQGNDHGKLEKLLTEDPAQSPTLTPADIILLHARATKNPQAAALLAKHLPAPLGDD